MTVCLVYTELAVSKYFITQEACDSPRRKLSWPCRRRSHPE